MIKLIFIPNYEKIRIFKYINFVKKIYQNTESIIANNGFLSYSFPLNRGVRQGCPLPLLLCIINGEVINLNVKSNPEIVGYPTPNQKHPLTLSQYADDTTFFVMSEKSITEILIFFKKYEMATGATINLSKTKILTLGNAKIYNLDQKTQNIQIIQPKNFIKILDIYFTTDLQKTSNFNWEQTTKILDKQLQHLSRRHLSLRGKAILLNSIILSKITLLRNIFPIPNNIHLK